MQADFGSAGYGRAVWRAYEEVALKAGDKIAIHGDRDAISFAQLRVESASLARALPSDLQGKVIGLAIEDPIYFMIAYFALAQSSVYLVLVDPRLSAKERAELLADMAVDRLLTCIDPKHDRIVGRVFETPAERQFELSATERVQGMESRATYQDGDFVVHTTSGSTGRPKGIAISGENVIARVASWRDSTSLRAEDVVFCMLTLSHCHGIEILMLPALLTGCSVVAPTPSSLSPRRISNLIARHEVTLLSSLPWFYILMNDAMEPAKCDFSSIRMMVSGSARIDPLVSRDFEEKFGIRIHQTYGLSEIGAICLDRKGADPTMVGPALDGVETKILPIGDDPDEGELLARGGGLARGYVNAPEAAADMFREGWLWTKDIVRKEAEGFRIVGRQSRFINSGGNKIAPSMIEDALMECGAVQEVAVKGISDPIEGEKIAAFIVWSGAPELALLQDHSRARLAAYCQPRDWISLPALPRNSIGKIMLEALDVPADHANTPPLTPDPNQTSGKTSSQTIGDA